MAGDLVLHLRIPSGEALARVKAAINRPPRRFLGVLKLEPEYIGIAGPDEFEIWERRSHAIHAVGRIREDGGLARVHTSFLLPGRTRILVVVFFLLYAIAGAGFVSLGPRAYGLVESSAILAVGGAALGLLFALSARHQRDELQRFLTGIFADVAG